MLMRTKVRNVTFTKSSKTNPPPPPPPPPLILMSSYMYPYLYESGSAIDRTTTLCLACSSSLPPKTTNDSSTAIYITKCCQRPICPSCLSSNPRLSRYDPCLFCLGGVDLVSMNGPSSSQGQRLTPLPADVNINGEVRDQDTFVLGDDDDDENDEERLESSAGDGATSISSPPLYESIVDPWKDESPPHETATLTSNPISLAQEPSFPKPDNTRPYKYYINRSDTLQGLSLRFGIDVSAIIQPLL